MDSPEKIQTTPSIWECLRPQTVSLLAGEVVLLCVLAFNTTGYLNVINPPGGWNDFGWPWTFLQTEWTAAQARRYTVWAYEHHGPPLEPVELPAGFWQDPSFTARPLFWNLLAAIGFAASVVVFSELLLRVRKTSIKFRPAHLAPALVVVGIAFILSRSAHAYMFLINNRQFFRTLFGITTLLTGVTVFFGLPYIVSKSLEASLE